MYSIQRNPTVQQIDFLQQEINDLRLNQGIPDVQTPGQYIREIGSWVLNNPEIQTSNDFVLDGPLVNNDIVAFDSTAGKFTNKPISDFDANYL